MRVNGREINNANLNKFKIFNILKSNSYEEMSVLDDIDKQVKRVRELQIQEIANFFMTYGRQGFIYSTPENYIGIPYYKVDIVKEYINGLPVFETKAFTNILFTGERFIICNPEYPIKISNYNDRELPAAVRDLTDQNGDPLWFYFVNCEYLKGSSRSEDSDDFHQV